MALKDARIVWKWTTASVFILVPLHVTVLAQIVRLLLFLGGRCRLSKMVFPLAAVEFLVLFVGRLLGLFGCCIGVHTLEHRADRLAIVCLTYNVPIECSSAFADWLEKLKDPLTISCLFGKQYPYPSILAYRSASLPFSIEKCIECDEPTNRMDTITRWTLRRS